MRSAVKRMKSNKASGPTGVVADMIKVAGELGQVWLQELFNLVLKEGRIPNDWSKSWMVSIYKGKGDALDCGSHRQRDKIIGTCYEAIRKNNRSTYYRNSVYR